MNREDMDLEWREKLSPVYTHSSLAELLEAAKSYEMSPDEKFEQRVSFVYGTLPFDSKVTREQVRQQLLKDKQ